MSTSISEFSDLFYLFIICLLVGLVDGKLIIYIVRLIGLLGGLLVTLVGS